MKIPCLYDSEETDSKQSRDWTRLLRRLTNVVTDWTWTPDLSCASGAEDDDTTLCQPKAANNISASDNILPLICVDTENDIGTPYRQMRPSVGLLRFLVEEVALAPTT